MRITPRRTIPTTIASQIELQQQYPAKVSIENAASSSRKAVFSRNDLKRASDCNVTDAFYGVIKAKYSLMDAEADMELKKKDLETAKIKYSLSIITKNSFSQAEQHMHPHRQRTTKLFQNCRTACPSSARA
ncbi:MAG: hypothetical protein ACYCYE_01915 [Clostridia bacterium]